VRPLPSAAKHQCGVFSARQALNAGWTRSALHHAVRTGVLIKLRPGAYQVTDLSLVAELNPYEQARWRHAAPGVATVLTTEAVASHSTAAVLQGIPLLFIPRQACVCVMPWWTGRIGGVHLHRCALPRKKLVDVNCTSTERIVVDLAREHGVAAGVVAADFALHERRTTLAKLDTELEGCRRWPGVRSAREAIAFADGRTESVLESRSRLALRDWGVPAPRPQARIGNEWGGFVGRLDFYWDEFGVGGEADGDVKYGGTDPEPLIEEKKRQGRFEDLEMPIVRWGSGDINDFGSVVARLRRAFARAARTPREERRWILLPPL
jgi:Transcriptional regulator, AbiEi antitoxin